MPVEKLDQLGKVSERAGQPVDLVDHHDIDLAGPDVGQQGLQGRAVERGTREAPIVVTVSNEPPALMGLALDVGLAGLPLGVEGVELEIEVMFGGLAGLDGTPQRLGLSRLHREAVRSPKNLGPFQAVPVMARAMVERLA